MNDFETVREGLSNAHTIDAQYRHVALDRIEAAYKRRMVEGFSHDGSCIEVKAEALTRARKAEAEVERLTALVTAMQTMALSTGGYTADQETLAAEVKRLQNVESALAASYERTAELEAEVERLRAALEVIAGQRDPYIETEHGDELVEFARAALAKEEA